MEAGIPQHVEILDGAEPGVGHGRLFKLGWNWHEGGVVLAVAPDGSLIRNAGWAGHETMRLEFVDAGRFRLRGPGRNEIRAYTFVDAWSQALIVASLEGRYVDAGGREYVFRRDGGAFLDGLEARFAIVNDPVMESHDFVEFEGEGRLLPGSEGTAHPFRRSGDVLTWYAHVPCQCAEYHGEADYGRPLLSMTLVPEATDVTAANP